MIRVPNVNDPAIKRIVERYGKEATSRAIKEFVFIQRNPELMLDAAKAGGLKPSDVVKICEARANDKDGSAEDLWHSLLKMTFMHIEFKAQAADILRGLRA